MLDDAILDDESIRMYEWNGMHYNAQFNGVPAGPGASLSLSSDGKFIAVGMPYDAPNGGSTRVYYHGHEYNYHSGSPCDDPSEESLPLRISFTTDGNPEETSWELRVDSEVKLRSGSLSDHKYTTFVEEMCVPFTSCVRFLVNDTRGDGVSFRPTWLCSVLRLCSYSRTNPSSTSWNLLASLR